MNNVKESINLNEIAKQSRVLNPNELMALLKSNIFVFMSWGAEQFTLDNKKNPKLFRMKVNGHLHKGYVYINVNGMDLFNVYLTDFNNQITDKVEDLYFDQLVDWIDEKVEKLSTYEF